jgi:hypothetical protein
MGILLPSGFITKAADPGFNVPHGLHGHPSSIGLHKGRRPRLQRGETGSQGQNGSDGPQGPPGEVSAAQLNTAIAGTSNNTNGVSTLSQIVDSTYNPTQMQDLMNKVDELIVALRR